MEYTVNISDEESKALLTDMMTVQEWLDNAIHNKARQCIDKVCEEALNDQTNTLLTKGEKQAIVTELAKQGTIISSIKQMPEVVKRQIVSQARVKSAAEKNAEFEQIIKS